MPVIGRLDKQVEDVLIAPASKGGCGEEAPSNPEETADARLRERLNHAVVVDEAGGSVVAFGSVVDLVDEASGTRKRYTLVSSMDADAAQGRLSMDSPVAQALRGCRAGDVATVETPRGARRWRVVGVS